MILQLGDWQFDIDMERTMEYSAAEASEHCDCAYCRNFYAAIDENYPQLRPFLAQFGLDLEAPDELMPFDLDGRMYYDGAYMVCGRILQTSVSPMEVSDIPILATSADDPNNPIHINHNCPEPYFALNIGAITLPWVLDEPMKDVVSPANFPDFLKKMWDKLLRKVGNNGTKS